MSEQKRPAIQWMDVLWLLFLAGLAAMPPVAEIHKQLTLLAIGVVQVSEGWLLARAPRRGAAYIVLLKIALATLLIDHTGEIGINSQYYPIFYLPVVTAAEYFSPLGTLLWTTLASAAYCSYLFDPALQDYRRDCGELWLARHAYCFLFSCGDGRKPGRRRESAPDHPLPGVG